MQKLSELRERHEVVIEDVQLLDLVVKEYWEGNTFE